MSDLTPEEAAHRGVDLAQTAMVAVAYDNASTAFGLIEAAPAEVLRVALGYYAANFNELLHHVTEGNEELARTVIQQAVELYNDDPLLAQLAAALMGGGTNA